MKLGSELVPHGHEVRVGRFRQGDSASKMVIRCKGHSTDVIVVNVNGIILRELNLNHSPNNTGMEVVYWDGEDAPARLYNSGMIWDPLQNFGTSLPGLPLPEPVGRMAWYHCIPANVCGDEREELVVYNPWTTKVYLYTQHDNDGSDLKVYNASPRQYNPRLMD